MLKKIIDNKKLLYMIFAIYMFALISVLVFKFPTGMVRETVKELIAGAHPYRHQMQLVPFKTIIEYASNVHSLTDWFIKNLACNIIMFMPLGVLLPLMLRGKDIGDKNNVKISNIVKIGSFEVNAFMVVFASGLALSVAIELVQYITALGLCDIDDVILNVLGSVFGYGVLMVLQKMLIK